MLPFAFNRAIIPFSIQVMGVRRSSIKTPAPAARTPQPPETRRRLGKGLEMARQELFEAIGRGEGSPGVLRQYSERMDGLVRDLFTGAHAEFPLPIAVAALGGYGRLQLCPYSDIDLLVLFGASIGRRAEKFLKAFLHPLWDLHLDLGHHVREIEDFEDLEEGNPEFLMALLDARFVAGDLDLYRRFQVLFHRADPRHYAKILESLLKLIDQRQTQFNNTFYQLEPDVKEAPGGLRDVVGTRWIALLTGKNGEGRLPDEEGRLDQAEDFLLRIRAILHRQTGRNHNVLDHEQQEKVAGLLGYSGATAQQSVEIFMSDYFRHARVVARSLESARRAIRPRASATAPAPAGEGLEQRDDEVGFRDPEEAAARPTQWLSLFQAAIDKGCKVSESALALIRQNLPGCRPEDFFPGDAERDRLLDFLRPRPGLYHRLSEMHDCGLLGAMFPEFQPIFCRVIRDFYHKYTVDEHTLLTLRNLERLGEPATASRERFSSILKALAAPELLVLALLFHDVGKWKDENHSEESVRMVQDVFRRLHLPRDSAATVEFLIKNHLQLSMVAFRRDTEDPEVVRRFASLLGTEENLKMLCLMTLVDIDAVSPDTLTPWKEELIWQLYVDTYNQLTLGYADEVIGENLPGLEAILADLPSDLTESEIAQFLDGFPRRYLKLVDRESVYRHVRLSRNIHSDEVHVSLESEAGIWELSVVTLDKPFLFSNISGVLSYFGMDILRGQAMTNRNGLVLDIFQFTDWEKFLTLNPDGIPQFHRLLENVVAGKLDLPTLLRGKERSMLYRQARKHVPTIIIFDNQHSPRYTILEIITQDALGLLYRISRVISRHGCDIHLVLISTEGNKAIDVFHIIGEDGKLTEASQTELKADLEKMLEDNP